MNTRAFILTRIYWRSFFNRWTHEYGISDESDQFSLAIRKNFRFFFFNFRETLDVNPLRFDYYNIYESLRNIYNM